MFWALLATGIMLLTGVGDDAYIQKEVLRLMEIAIKEVVVDDSERRDAALKNVGNFRQLLFDHREVLGKAGDCMEKADRSYKVTKEDYYACTVGIEERFAETEEEYVRLDAEQKTLLTSKEIEVVGKKILKGLQ